MAINWSAYEACKELYGNNIENIQDIGSRFPLFARACMQVNDEALLDILGALPKVTARVVESGLKELGSGEETEVEEEVQEEKPAKKETKKTTKKAKKEEVEEDEDSDEEETNEYESMSAKELYKLCCERGISSHCKSRSKDALIEVLEKYDNGELESAKKSKKAEKEEPKKKGRKAKKEEPVEEADEDEWDEEEDSEEADPYAGKTAKELYKLCTDRGIKTKPKQNADAYVKLLKKADEAELEEDDTEDEDDEWEI